MHKIGLIPQKFCVVYEVSTLLEIVWIKKTQMCQKRTVLFWVIAQRIMLIPDLCFVRRYRSHHQSGIWILDPWRCDWHIGKKLPPLTVITHKSAVVIYFVAEAW